MLLPFTLPLALLVALAQDPVERARELIEAGRSLEALQELEQAARLQPDDAAIQHALGALYASGGRISEATTHIERAVALAPEDPSYALAHGELLYRSGRLEEALSPLEKASSLPEALVLLAAVYEKLGPKEKMFETLSKYIELAPEDTATRVLLGQQLEAAKRYPEALEVYQGGSPDPLLAYHAANVLARERETYAEAETLARNALEASPDLPDRPDRPDRLDAGLLLARVLERQGRYDEALAELERLKGKHPDAAKLHYQLATAYQRAGRADEAQASAARFQELSAKEKEKTERDARVAVTYKQAADLLQRGRMLEAESVYRSVLEIDPDHAQTKSMLAKIAFSKGDVAAAHRWIAEAIAADEEVGEYHYLSALFDLKAGRPAEAIESVRRSLELDPAFPDAWSMLGSLLLDSGDAEQAVDCFLKASALEPSNATVYLNLASAHSALGNEAEEEAAMERYRSLTRR